MAARLVLKQDPQQVTPVGQRWLGMQYKHKPCDHPAHCAWSHRLREGCRVELAENLQPCKFEHCLIRQTVGVAQARRPT